MQKSLTTKKPHCVHGDIGMQLLIEETGVAFIFGSDNFSREVRTMCEKLLYDVSGLF